MALNHSMKSLILICLVVICLISIAPTSINARCFDENNIDEPYEPQRNRDMKTCCWYTDLTCCSGQSGDRLLNDTYDFFLRLVDSAHKNNVTLHKHNQACMDYMADFWCSSCAPNTYDFVKLKGKQWQVSLCQSWCDRFYHACENTPYFGDIKSGTDMCKYMETQWQGSHVKIMPASAIDGEHHCFDGVNDEVVNAAECTPFYFSEGSNDDNNHNNNNNNNNQNNQNSQHHDDDSNTGTIIAIVLSSVGGALLLVLVVIGAIIAWRVYSKRYRNRHTRPYTPTMQLDGDDNGDEFASSTSVVEDEDGL